MIELIDARAERDVEERLVLPAEQASAHLVRRRLLRLCAVCAVDEEAAGEFAIALTEAFSNAVLHGAGPGGGDVEARVRLNRTLGHVILEYPGEPFETKAPRLPDATATGGRGRYLMRCFADEVRYEFAGGRTCVTLVRRWQR